MYETYPEIAKRTKTEEPEIRRGGSVNQFRTVVVRGFLGFLQPMMRAFLQASPSHALWHGAYGSLR